MPAALRTIRARRCTITPPMAPITTARTVRTARTDPTAGDGSRRIRKRRAQPRRGGRPSQADAARLGDHILEVATELFLTEGYGSATIDAVAARAGVSKRTLYHRFADKSALFVAVVHRIVSLIRPPPGVALLEGSNPQEILRRLAGFVLQAALSPQAIALHRLVMAEAARFPELVRAVYDEGWADEAAALIGSVLERALRDGRPSPRGAAFAAEQFLQMIVTVPQRRALGIGVPMRRAELDSWVEDTVRLFLQGIQGLTRLQGRGISRPR
jgi:TetR/AcrR family transcriptional repressor of mexJK operon